MSRCSRPEACRTWSASQSCRRAARSRTSWNGGVRLARSPSLAVGVRAGRSVGGRLARRSAGSTSSVLDGQSPPDAGLGRLGRGRAARTGRRDRVRERAARPLAAGGTSGSVADAAGRGLAREAGQLERDVRLQRVAQRIVGRRRVARADEAEEIHAVDELHRVEAMVVREDQLVDLDQVGVRDVRERAEFLLEPVDRRGVGVEDRLDRHAHVALEVIRLVDDPHAAGPDPSPHGEAIGAAEFAGSVEIPSRPRCHDPRGFADNFWPTYASSLQDNGECTRDRRVTARGILVGWPLPADRGPSPGAVLTRPETARSVGHFDFRYSRRSTRSPSARSVPYSWPMLWLPDNRVSKTNRGLVGVGFPVADHRRGRILARRGGR